MNPGKNFYRNLLLMAMCLIPSYNKLKVQMLMGGLDYSSNGKGSFLLGLAHEIYSN
ncbi:hypothetical protein D3C74_224690 [compost metagenome]